jgi:hypothetical protein
VLPRRRRRGRLGRAVEAIVYHVLSLTDRVGNPALEQLADFLLGEVQAGRAVLVTKRVPAGPRGMPCCVYVARRRAAGGAMSAGCPGRSAYRSSARDDALGVGLTGPSSTTKGYGRPPGARFLVETFKTRLTSVDRLTAISNANRIAMFEEEWLGSEPSRINES